MRKPTKPLPKSREEWLVEIAVAYRDAREAIPFGEMLGEPFREADLFHLATAVAVKFRGSSQSARLRKRASDAALASYAANRPAHRSVLKDPYLAFAFCYLASHHGLRLLTAERVEALMADMERNRKTLDLLIAGGTKSNTALHRTGLAMLAPAGERQRSTGPPARRRSPRPVNVDVRLHKEMTSTTSHHARRLLPAAVLVFFASDALAKRPSDYLPPAYILRLASSLITLSVLAGALGVVLYGMCVLLDQAGSRAGRTRFAGIVAGLTLVGAALAAADALNDEGWNPALWGGLVISLSAPAALVQLARARPLWVRVLLGGGLVIPVYYWLVLVGIPFQAWGAKNGLPTTW